MSGIGCRQWRKLRAYEGSKNETFRVLEPELNGDDVDQVGITEKWDSGNEDGGDGSDEQMMEILYLFVYQSNLRHEQVS